MKAKVSKMILLTCILCAMSFTVCACGGEKEAEAAITGTGEEDDQPADAADTSNPTENSNVPADMQQEQPTVEKMPASWKDRAPDLEGDIKEMQEGQLTVLKAVTSETDDGAYEMVMLAPDADDSDFNKVKVTYDEKTGFAVETIYDGGARSEVKEATAADLEKGQLIEVWGSFAGEDLVADQICIIKVE